MSGVEMVSNLARVRVYAPDAIKDMMDVEAVVLHQRIAS
jgi:hypothetical protein